MSTTPYYDEKAPLVLEQELPAPVPVTIRHKRPNVFLRLIKFTIAFFGTLLVLDLFMHGPAARGISRGCHGMRPHHGHHGKHGHDGGDGHQHPFPPIDNWKPFEGTTHFEFDPKVASSFSVRGAKSFGKVVFETSKLSDKVVIDLDIKTNKVDKDHEVVVKEEAGGLTISTPNTGHLKIHTAARIQIPSNIIGTFGIPSFEVDVPRFMVDYSELPESLEIGAFTVRVAKGFVKPGLVHTNTTTISIAEGAIRGTLTHARNNTDVNVVKGNAELNIPKISSGSEGTTTVHLGNGHLNGSFAIYNSTAIDVAKGSIWIDADFMDNEHRADFSTKLGSGYKRVFVNSIASERLFSSSHNSVAGDQLITYPANFQGTIDARGVVGNVKLAGEDLDVEKVIGGLVGKQGDSDRNYITVKAVKGALDILVGDEDEE
ncbi:hypothetical protein EDD37DRAFT_613935 [Exophiala viscosa]|uniref:uncharacterized protein n=1 Tax=Exophiala viscosa TaxID=2486360 RepID=UPI00218FB237|nr:hypothetical protein EDD37DRAFT_613935 [Exophiala viscosa]